MNKNNPQTLTNVAYKTKVYWPDPRTAFCFSDLGFYCFEVRKVHYFESTREAYEWTMCGGEHMFAPEDWNNLQNIKNGDTLVVKSEGVVGVASTWPTAVTKQQGAFHSFGYLGWELNEEDYYEWDGEDDVSKMAKEKDWDFACRLFQVEKMRDSEFAAKAAERIKPISLHESACDGWGEDSEFHTHEEAADYIIKKWSENYLMNHDGGPITDGVVRLDINRGTTWKALKDSRRET